MSAATHELCPEAEDYHQQYLHKNPFGCCNHGFCQVAYTPEQHGQVGLVSS